jgi:hypothetical protein
MGKKASGCNPLVFVSVIVTVGFLLLSAYVVYPLSERVFSEFLCPNGRVSSVNRGRGKGRDITCTDNVTGQKTNISVAQFLACCPAAILPVISIGLVLGGNLLTRRKMR